MEHYLTNDVMGQCKNVGTRQGDTNFKRGTDTIALFTSVPGRKRSCEPAHANLPFPAKPTTKVPLIILCSTVWSPGMSLAHGLFRRLAFTLLTPAVHKGLILLPLAPPPFD